MQNGDRVRCVIDGFSGIATGMTEYINGCRQFLVEPEKLDKEGKPIAGMWIDEQKLEVVSAGIQTNPFASSAAPVAGGPNRRERAT